MTAAITCSFCEKEQIKARFMVQGPPGHCICDSCIMLCVDIMLGNSDRQTPAERRLVARPLNRAAADRHAEQFLVDRIAELRASIPVHVLGDDIIAWCHRFIDEWDRAVRAEARRGGQDIGEAYDAFLALVSDDPKATPYRVALLRFADGSRPIPITFRNHVRSLAHGYGTWERT